MNTETEIRALVAKAIAAQLDGADELAEAPVWALCRAYNGCGADWMPQSLRDRLTSLFAIFAPAFLIHDWDYTNSDGSEEKFHAANLRLFTNCRRLADASYGWLNWRRYRAREAALLIYETVEDFGRPAWLLAAGSSAGSCGAAVRRLVPELQTKGTTNETNS